MDVDKLEALEALGVDPSEALDDEEERLRWKEAQMKKTKSTQGEVPYLLGIRYKQDNGSDGGDGTQDLEELEQNIRDNFADLHDQDPERAVTLLTDLTQAVQDQHQIETDEVDQTERPKRPRTMAGELERTMEGRLPSKLSNTDKPMMRRKGTERGPFAWLDDLVASGSSQVTQKAESPEPEPAFYDGSETSWDRAVTEVDRTVQEIFSPGVRQKTRQSTRLKGSEGGWLDDWLNGKQVTTKSRGGWSLDEYLERLADESKNQPD